MPRKIDRDERIGERLLRYNIIDTYHLNNVLIRQRHGDKRRFGEIAVDLGYAAKNSVESCVQTQGMDLYESENGIKTNKKSLSINAKKAE